MNKFSVALVSAFAASAQASKIQAQATTQQNADYSGKPDFNIGNHYQQPDYSTPYQAHEQLPTGDFNRRVYEFDNGDAIWDQNDYEERVKVEAELMVALESMKEGVQYGSHDVKDLSESIQYQYQRISANADDIYENMVAATASYNDSINRVYDVQARCQYIQNDLHDTKDVLILYCQQFAYAPEMTPACQRILTHKHCDIGMRYSFGRFPDQYNSGYVAKDGYGEDIHFSQSNQPYYDGSALSTHGYELNLTGGHVEPANPYVEPELAAAAVSPYEAVIQIDGQSHIVPLEQIDSDKVELACDDDGCALIPDDGYAGNDLHLLQDYGSDNYDQQYVAPHQSGLSAAEEIAAAQHNEYEVRVKVDGETHLVPIDEIDTNKTELECDGQECYLVPDDGNPYNDIIPGDHEHYASAPAAPVYQEPVEPVYQEPTTSVYRPDFNTSGPDYSSTPVTSGISAADAEIAAAQHNDYEVRVQVDGQNLLVPIDQIDTDKTELECDGEACYLVPDDGNPYNDIVPGDHTHTPTFTYNYQEDKLYPGMPDYQSVDYPTQAPFPLQSTSDSYGSDYGFGGGDHGFGGNDYGSGSGDFFDGSGIESAMQGIHDDIYNSHNMDFPLLGGNIQVNQNVHPELAAAAYDNNQAVIVHEGEAFLAPFDAINTDAVELACTDHGCALIPDDGMSHNDIYVPGM